MAPKKSPTTAGRLLIEDALPETLKADLPEELNKKGIGDLFGKLAELGSDEYRDTAYKLQKLGDIGTLYSGGYSFNPAHMLASPEVDKVRNDIRTNISHILKDRTLDPTKRNQLIVDTVNNSKPKLMDVLKKSMTKDNKLAMQIVSGAKGNIDNFASLVAGDLLYNDQNYKPIPFPVLKSYAEGLDPHEYWASTYGGRQGIVLLKLGTATSGYAAKRVMQAAHRASVVDLDAPEHEKSPHLRGLPVKTGDPDNEGSLLAHDVGPYKKNTVITKNIMEDLENKGIDDILVRSASVGGHYSGGVYARDVGLMDHNVLPPRGYQAGIVSANAVSEPMTQTVISSKHTGGVAGATKGQQGFPVMDQMISVPETYKGGAVYSSKDGIVKSVAPTGYGGFFVNVDGQAHYVDPEREITVKPGDKVEAGDTLSDGVHNPSEVVKYQGIGEARKQFIQHFSEVARNSGFKPHRRNLELIVKGLINHVKLKDELDEFSPGEIVPYHVVEHRYKPRKDSQDLTVTAAKGQYLEQPVLHHTIGTRITSKVQNDLKKFGVQNVKAHKEPPMFEPTMIRSHDVAGHDPDWGTRFLGMNLNKNILRAAHTGGVSDEVSSSFVPTLMAGGKNLPEFKNWGPNATK